MSDQRHALSDAASASDWSGRRVLVTGGVGFLGSALCHALARLGAEVTALDSFLEGGGAMACNLAGVPATLVRADLRTSPLEPLVAGQQVIFNLAAQTGHTRGERQPLEDLEINATAQVRLIQALRQAAPDALVVHASTRQVYGRSVALPVSEARLPCPPDANAVAKLAGEQYWMLEHRQRGRPVVSLRLTNCYGPRQRVNDAQQCFLGAWIGAVLRGRPFEVWGGDQVRDFCFVDDAVNAFLLAAVTPACHGEVLNVGGGSCVSLGVLAALLAKESGGGFAQRPMPEAQAMIDMGDFRADDSRLRSLSGWHPEVGLEDGLKRTLDWFRPRAAAYLA